MNAISRRAKKSKDPNKYDMKALKRIVRYLAGTKEKGIRFPAKGMIKLSCFVDAGYNQTDEARSWTGYLFTLGEDDPAFYARSCQQK